MERTRSSSQRIKKYHVQKNAGNSGFSFHEIVFPYKGKTITEKCYLTLLTTLREKYKEKTISS